MSHSETMFKSIPAVAAAGRGRCRLIQVSGVGLRPQGFLVWIPSDFFFLLWVSLKVVCDSEHRWARGSHHAAGHECVTDSRHFTPLTSLKFSSFTFPRVDLVANCTSIGNFFFFFIFSFRSTKNTNYDLMLKSQSNSSDLPRQFSATRVKWQQATRKYILVFAHKYTNSKDR